MKRLILSIALSLGTLMAGALPYGEARQHALFLTDKMAYELNLTEHQYDDAYQINLDYFLCVNSPNDIYGPHYRFRNRDLRYILLDWQYALYAAADYFVQPLLWRANSWFLPILHRYDRAHFYFAHPRVFDVYRGGGHINYVTRRPPKWHGGMTGHAPHGGAHPDYNYRHPGNHQPPPQPGYMNPGMGNRPHQPGGQQPGHHQPNMGGNKPQHPNGGGNNQRPGGSTVQRPTGSGQPITNGRPNANRQPSAPTRSSGNSNNGSSSRHGGRGSR